MKASLGKLDPAFESWTGILITAAFQALRFAQVWARNAASDTRSCYRDITTHYSAPGDAELLTAVSKIEAGESAAALNLIRAK
jgi:hypothetical protein